MKLLPILLTLVCLSSPLIPMWSAWAAAQPSCEDFLVDPAHKTRLAEISPLHPSISAFLKDPHAPQTLKNFLRRILIHPELAVQKLTKKRRKAWGVSPNAVAYMTAFNRAILEVIDPEHGPSWNSEGEFGPLHHPFDPLSRDTTTLRLFVTVPVKARSQSKITAEVGTLVHELTHARFELFLNQNFKRLARLIPKRFLRVNTQGKREVDEQFINFINERLAYEAEFQYLSSVRKADEDLEDFPDFFESEMFSLPANKARYRIAKSVASSYKITNPEVLELSVYSVGEILTGAPWQAPRNSFFRRLKREVVSRWWEITEMAIAF